MFYNKYFKRFIDVLLSMIGIILLSPIFLIIMILIKADSKGPIYFRQKRVGIYKTHFNIIKFRTMKINAPKDCATHLLDNPNFYITKVGRFLRKSSLDELPQLFNIIKGEMSFVGPRPALWNQYDLIKQRDLYNANNIRPGITGLAQISGRDELEIDIKAMYDGQYAREISIFFDIKCIIITAIDVIKKRGIVEGSTDTTKSKQKN